MVLPFPSNLGSGTPSERRIPKLTPLDLTAVTAYFIAAVLSDQQRSKLLCFPSLIDGSTHLLTGSSEEGNSYRIPRELVLLNQSLV